MCSPAVFAGAVSCGCCGWCGWCGWCNAAGAADASCSTGARELDRLLGPPVAGGGTAVAAAVALAGWLDPEQCVDDGIVDGGRRVAECPARRVAPLAVRRRAVAVPRGVDHGVPAAERVGQP